MIGKEFPKTRTAKFLRWTARVFGAFIDSFWLFIIILSLIDEPVSRDVESLILVGLLSGSIIGVDIAWFREFESGIFLLIIPVARSAFAFIEAGNNKGLAMLNSGGPFFDIRFLFIAAWRNSLTSKRSTIGR